MIKCIHKVGRTCILDGMVPLKADCEVCPNYQPEEKGDMTVLDALPIWGAKKAAEEIRMRADWPAYKLEAWLREPWRAR